MTKWQAGLTSAYANPLSAPSTQGSLWICKIIRDFRGHWEEGAQCPPSSLTAAPSQPCCCPSSQGTAGSKQEGLTLAHFAHSRWVEKASFFYITLILFSYWCFEAWAPRWLSHRCICQGTSRASLSAAQWPSLLHLPTFPSQRCSQKGPGLQLYWKSNRLLSPLGQRLCNLHPTAACVPEVQI